MDTMNRLPSQSRFKVARWIYWLLLGLVLAGILYVLLAPFSGTMSLSSDKTPLDGIGLLVHPIHFADFGNHPGVSGIGGGGRLWAGLSHASTPGHNKTLVGSYPVGACGRVSLALLIGIVTALSHTASAFIVGLLALSAAGQVASAQYLQWVGLPSGVLTVGLGLWLIRNYIRAGNANAHPRGPEHDHGHSHPHSIDAVMLRGLLALGLMHGIVPTFEALAIVLVAISLQQAIVGAGLIFAYSLGSVLVVVGMLVVRAQSALFDHPRFERAALRRLSLVWSSCLACG